MSIPAFAIPQPPQPPMERRRRHTLSGVAPSPAFATASPASPAKGSTTTAPDRRAHGLESVNAARAALARMLGTLELFALSGADEDGLEGVRRDAASISTHLCEITASFVALTAEEKPVSATAQVPPSETATPPPPASAEMRMRLEHLCSFPVTTLAGILFETSIALNKMAGAFMRVAG
ncbi:MAG TPA: hypothetical protein VM580_08150, partial [Labilithrix sp.]|nr:hypothetical protein [Labilithrix sp.]